MADIKYLKKKLYGVLVERLAFFLARQYKVFFDNSENYWERRYRRKGTSGSGSYGRLANFKAEVINNFVVKEKINSIIEFGSGDGNQLSLMRFPKYVGVDVSKEAVKLCKEKFKKDDSKSFLQSWEYTGKVHELAISLDVIYHLVEDDVFREYMEILFSSASRYVVIYSSNFDNDSYTAPHVKHRCFTEWVESERKDFTLVNVIKNPYPYEIKNKKNTSSADFYFFKKNFD